jgi:dynamin GTPase
MEESQFEAQKRQEVIRMYQACKEALQIITDANLDGLQMDPGRMAINPSPVNVGRPAPMPPAGRKYDIIYLKIAF